MSGDKVTYSVKEMIQHFRNDVSESFGKLDIRLEKIDEKQAIANGRTAKLENAKIQIWTAMGVIFAIGGVIITLGIYSLKATIKEVVVETLKENAEVIYENH